MIPKMGDRVHYLSGEHGCLPATVAVQASDPSLVVKWPDGSQLVVTLCCQDQGREFPGTWHFFEEG